MTNSSSLPALINAVEAAGRTLAKRFDANARPSSLEALLAAIDDNDNAVIPDLRLALLAARPGSQWVEDEEAGGALPDGEWWIADPAEGNVNHIHGRSNWGVTATLVSDNVPVLTAVHFPLSGETITATLGGGTLLNGKALRVSEKTELNAAIMATGQAKPGESQETLVRIGSSVTAMLQQSLLVRMSVPATFELLDVAAGRLDGFWQFSQVRSGLAGGALLVKEAGGSVTDTDGLPWTLASKDIVAIAPGLHAAALLALSSSNHKE